MSSSLHGGQTPSGGRGNQSASFSSSQDDSNHGFLSNNNHRQSSNSRSSNQYSSSVRVKAGFNNRKRRAAGQPLDNTSIPTLKMQHVGDSLGRTGMTGRTSGRNTTRSNHFLKMAQEQQSEDQRRGGVPPLKARPSMPSKHPSSTRLSNTIDTVTDAGRGVTTWVANKMKKVQQGVEATYVSKAESDGSYFGALAKSATSARKSPPPRPPSRAGRNQQRQQQQQQQQQKAVVNLCCDSDEETEDDTTGPQESRKRTAAAARKRQPYEKRQSHTTATNQSKEDNVEYCPPPTKNPASSPSVPRKTPKHNDNHREPMPEQQQEMSRNTRPIEENTPRQAPEDFTGRSQSSWYDEDSKRSQHRKQSHSSAKETLKRRKSKPTPNMEQQQPLCQSRNESPKGRKCRENDKIDIYHAHQDSSPRDSQSSQDEHLPPPEEQLDIQDVDGDDNGKFESQSRSRPKPANRPVSTSFPTSFGNLNNVQDLLTPGEEKQDFSVATRAFVETIGSDPGQPLVAPSKRGKPKGAPTSVLALSKQNGASKKPLKTGRGARSNSPNPLGTDRDVEVNANASRQHGFDPKKFHQRSDVNQSSRLRSRKGSVVAQTNGSRSSKSNLEMDLSSDSHSSDSAYHLSSDSEYYENARSHNSGRGNSTEVVEIDDESCRSEDDIDEYSASDTEGANGGLLTQNSSGPTRRSSPRNRRKSMEEKLFDMDVARVAIGKKVSTSGCHVAFSAAGKWMIEYDDTKSSDRVTHQICSVAIKELRYYKTDTDVPLGKIPANFISMKINANKSNGLAVLSNSYSQDKGVECKYVVIDFLSAEHLDMLLNDLRAVHVQKGSRFSGMRDESKTQLTREEVPTFAKALMDASEKESRNCRQPSPQQDCRNGVDNSLSWQTRKRNFIGGRKKKTVLLVYPFTGDTKDIDAAANGLCEANYTFDPEAGNSLAENGNDRMQDERKPAAEEWIGAASPTTKREDPSAVLLPKIESPIIDSTKDEHKPAAEDLNGVPPTTMLPKTKQRAHYLTIRVKDYDRLDPGEWLNDSLIDFWMQWIWRKEEKSTSNLHFFTSHFFTALKKNGPEEVANWTAKKNIDIFSKKLIFIPINKALHWSLCVVINPGAIMNLHARGGEEDVTDDAKFPCILFLDSLKAHSQAMVKKNICKWLNFEWNRLGRVEAGTPESPFDTNAFLLGQPPVPYQDNGWDCGVFVCRYAYSMLLLRDKEFSFADAGFARDTTGAPRRPPKVCRSLISNSEAFQFDMGDIVRLRSEIRTLIERLSIVYLAWKEKNLEEDKEMPDASPGKAEVVSPTGEPKEEAYPEKTMLQEVATDMHDDIARADEDAVPQETVTYLHEDISKTAIDEVEDHGHDKHAYIEESPPENSDEETERLDHAGGETMTEELTRSRPSPPPGVEEEKENAVNSPARLESYGLATSQLFCEI